MEFNFDRREIYMPEKYFKKDKLIELSPKENLLFKLLWENKNNVIAYKDIINEVYGYEDITEQDKQNIRKMRKNRMKFKINGDIWTIHMKSKEEMKEMYEEEKYSDEDVFFVFGLTNKAMHCIYINKDMHSEQQIKTLKHELTHCFIWNYALFNVPHYTEEMVCDLVASINDFINEVVDRFKKEKKQCQN